MFFLAPDDPTPPREAGARQGLRRLEAAMSDAGCLGGKAAGSGAGGSMFFLAPDDPTPAREAVARLGMRLLPVRWATTGVRAC